MLHGIKIDRTSEMVREDPLSAKHDELIKNMIILFTVVMNK